jgi:O-acetyl-ADP-ribose deacetylase (regulator of RNase III)
MLAHQKIMNTILRAIHGDITTLAVDAIVNAANPWLGGGDPVGPGGGVDGAIHRAAGPELLEACRPFGGCRAGEAKITAAYRLPSKYVIHTVGPTWTGGGDGELKLLESCYQQSLAIAASMQFASIAFPCVSCGSYGFPLKLAAETAVKTVRRFAGNPSSLQEVIFCCFSSSDLAVYEDLIGR